MIKIVKLGEIKEKKLPLVEFWKDKDGYNIRKGMLRNHCVVDNLDRKDLEILYDNMTKLLKKLPRRQKITSGKIDINQLKVENYGKQKNKK